MTFRHLLLLPILVLMFNSCDTVEPLAGPGTHAYYPYQTGDEYVMEEWAKPQSTEFTDTITYRVVDVVKLGTYAYNLIIGTADLMYFPGSEPLPRTPDTSYIRVSGSKLIKWHKEGEYIYLDFDAPYVHSLERHAPIGFVRDTANVETQAGTFRDCKLMRPGQPFHEQFIYAKDAGLVKAFGPDYRLTLLSAKIGGKVLP